MQRKTINEQRRKDRKKGTSGPLFCCGGWSMYGDLKILKDTHKGGVVLVETNSTVLGDVKVTGTVNRDRLSRQSIQGVRLVHCSFTEADKK